MGVDVPLVLAERLDLLLDVLDSLDKGDQITPAKDRRSGKPPQGEVPNVVSEPLIRGLSWLCWPTVAAVIEARASAAGGFPDRSARITVYF